MAKPILIAAGVAVLALAAFALISGDLSPGTPDTTLALEQVPMPTDRAQPIAAE